MKKFNELLFGTAGIPLSTSPSSTVNGIAQVKKLGLSAMELEFVQNINIKEEMAPLVREAAEKNDVVLTCHGQYFINLNAVETKKLEESKQRIYMAAKRAYECGAWSVCFHPGFYLGQEPKNVYEKVKGALKEVVARLSNEGISIWVRPETTGKATQFGSLEELVSLSLEIDNVLPCIDFSHLCARSNGKINNLEEFSNALSLVESRLGKDALKQMHAHVQGVSFSEKGEKAHLPFSESVFDYKGTVKALKDFSAKGAVICESPLMEKDAIFLQQEFLKA